MTRAQRLLLAALGAAIALGLLWQLVPISDAQVRVASLPRRGIGYDSIDVPLTPAEIAVFGAAQVLKRTYRIGGDVFSVIVIDGTRNRHAVHDPLLCVRGAGWSIERRVDLELPGGHGSSVVIAKDGTSSSVAFWFSDGAARSPSALHAWWQATARRVSFGLSGDEPVLVLLQGEAGHLVDWQRLINDRFLAVVAL